MSDCCKNLDNKEEPRSGCCCNKEKVESPEYVVVGEGGSNEPLVAINRDRYKELLKKEWCLDRLTEIMDGLGFIAAKINELTPKAAVSRKFNVFRYLQSIYEGLFAPKLETSDE